MGGGTNPRPFSRMSLRHWFHLTRASVVTATNGFSDDELMTRAAALSF
jgi:membrane protein